MTMTPTALLARELFTTSTTFVEWMGAQDMSPKTQMTRRRFKVAREVEWGTWDKPADEIAAWLRRYQGWTRRTYYAHLACVYGWLVDTGRISVNPMALIPWPPTPRKRARPLSEDELGLALGAAWGDVRAYLMLGYLQGLRAGEVAAMHGRSITDSGLYVMGKGGQGDMLPTHPLVWELAQQYPRNDHWFPSTVPHRQHIRSERVTYQVGVLFRRIGLEGSSHRARHTYGTDLLRGGANIKVVQELLRHRSLATTQIYLGTDEDELRRAVHGLRLSA